MSNLQSVKTDIWLKAAVAGSLWASLEIILGSFFHNARIPFAGTILAIMGLSLMIAFSIRWEAKNWIWRAGLIAALMKSISPSAIILGPMIGILMEAVILELAIKYLGRNFFGYIVGSVIALQSALFHKIATILIMYGFDILSLIKKVYYFLVHQFHISFLGIKEAFVLLVLIYILLALLTVWIGVKIGKRSLQIKNEAIKWSDASEERLFFQDKHKNKYAVFYLFFHFILLIGFLYCINFYSWKISFPLVIIYLLYALLIYKLPFRRFKKLSFWGQLLILLLLTIVFWNGFSWSNWGEWTAYIVGLKMIFRAFVVIVSFAIISIELRSPVIKNILYKKGFAQLYTFLGLSFSVLPLLLKKTVKAKQIVKNPLHYLAYMLSLSESLMRYFEQSLQKQKSIYIITGKQREGKTTFLKKLISQLAESNLSIFGFLALGIDKNGERLGFELENVETKEKRLLCNRTMKTDLSIGRFYFDEETFRWASQVFENTSEKDIAVIDEVGLLELQDKGWNRTLEHLLNSKTNTLIWVVRKDLTLDIIKKWNLTNVKTIAISEYSVEDIANLILKEKNYK